MAVSIEVLQGGDIGQCRELCNELMALQKARAHLHPECFDGMNFETRMRSSYEKALRKQVVVAKDAGVPVGYVFSTIDEVPEAVRTACPAWAPNGGKGTGFYPDWVKLPQKIGCLNNLYLRDSYRSSGLGTKLFAASVEWLESFDDVDLSFVYISNGNDAAMRFYLRNGFEFSHDVFGGFIQAAYRRKVAGNNNREAGL